MNKDKEHHFDEADRYLHTENQQAMKEHGESQAEKTLKGAQQQGSNRGVLVVSVLALIISIASLGAQYVMLRSSDQHFAEYDSKLAKLELKFADYDQKVKAFDSRALPELLAEYQNMQGQVVKLQTELLGVQSELAKTHTELSAVQSELSTIKQIADQPQREEATSLYALHLLQAAHIKITLDRDLRLAKELLLKAQEVLKTSDLKHIDEIRQAIIDDIATIDSIRIVDYVAIDRELLSLIHSVDNMPLMMGAERNYKALTISSQVSDWKENIKHSVKELLAKFIILEPRKQGDNVMVLPPTQESLVREHLRLQLTIAQINARLAHEKNYQSALEAVDLLIHRYFDLDDEQVKNFVFSLERLQKMTVEQDVPSELGSRLVLQSLLKE